MHNIMCTAHVMHLPRNNRSTIYILYVGTALFIVKKKMRLIRNDDSYGLCLISTGR